MGGDEANHLIESLLLLDSYLFIKVNTTHK